MKTIRLSLALVMVAAATTWASWFGGEKNDTNEQLAKLFGDNTAFTATANVAVAGRSKKETHAAEMQYAFHDGKMRTEIDMTKIKAGAKRQNAMEDMSALGMDKMVNLHRPDKKVSYLIYPGLKAYCEFTPPTGKQGADQPAKIEKKEIGKATIDGHPCIQYLVTITAASGSKTEVTTWEATDLKNFPIQSEIKADGDTVTTKFSNINFAKPDAALFEVPAGFKRYGSVQEMMMGAMQQMMQGGEQ